MMDWALLVMQFILLAYFIMLGKEITQLGVELRKLREELDKFRVRQSKIKSRPRNEGTPIVDARAITTQRDTDDLPLTGRQGIGLHRRKRDYGTADDG
jgi:hypothetical protein